jgi:ABC-type dipeptide/oligopeptide/nickel transport system permease component
MCMHTKAIAVIVSAVIVMLMVGTISFILLTMVPVKSYAALCGDPNKSSAYFNGYVAAHDDFRSGHGKNQSVNSTNSQYSKDYKEGYEDGWDDAQTNIDVFENSIC